MAVRQRGYVRVRRSSSLKTWAGFTSGVAFTALAAGSSVVVGSFIAGADLTLLRTRGLLAIQNDQIASSEDVHGALGMARVSEDAFNTGTGALPDPVDDIGSDSWVVWLPFAHTIQRGASGVNAPAASLFVVDSKAMRKFHADERLAVVLRNENSVAGLQYHLTLRALVRTGAGA